MAAHELIDYFENGNIAHSVNYPSITMPRSSGNRIVVLHKNVPNMISPITAALSETGNNIENMANRSRGEYAVTLLDTDESAEPDTIEKMKSIDGVIRVIQITH